MLWSDRVAGARRRRAANEIGNSGGRGLPRPVRSIQDTVTGPQAADPAPVTAAAGPRPTGPRPAEPRVEVRPEGWRLVDRRGLLKFAGVSAVAAPTASLLAACGGAGSGDDGERTVRIGLVSPRSGALRAYSEVENHVAETMKTIFVDGMRVGRNTLPVEIFVRDGQSDRNRAAAAAADLIFTDQVDVVLVGGSTENVNPVSDICEANGVPCVSTQSPWESWFFGRGGDVQTPFSWTYHFFWGMDDLTSSYTAMWGQLDVPRRVGMLTPADQDGQTFRSPSGMPKIGQAGYELIEVPYTVGQRDFGAQVEMLKSRDIPIITGVPNREDFAGFWRRLNDENYLPHVVTMSKALLFPADVDNLGSTGNGFTTEVAWSPKHPFRSFLTNQTAEELAAEYFDQTGRAWTQSLGFAHALFEVVAQALANVDSIDNARGIADAISRVTARTIVGTVAFGSTRELPKNVARIPLVGGQWQQQDNNFDLRIVNNNGINIQPEANIVDLHTAQQR